MEDLAKLRGTRNVNLRHLSNLESKVKELTASTETSNNNIISLRGTKNNFVDKLNKVKKLDDEILDLLSDKPNDYEKELEQNLYREDSYFELIALADQFLEMLNLNTSQAYAASSPVSVVNSSNNNFRTNLPKLIIKQFDGGILNCQTFWDQYYSSVHVKTNISEIDKFTYLKSLLSESAFETISGLTLTSGNYVEAIKLLQNRYGNHQALINAYMDKFVQLEAITKSSDITRLRKVYNQIETGIRNLKTFDVHPESYGSLLVPVLSTKLPGDVRTLFARTFNHGKWDLTEMMEIFKKKFEAKECAFATINYKSRDKNNSQFISSALFNNSEKN